MSGIIERVKISTGEEIVVAKPTLLQVRSMNDIADEEQQTFTMLCNLTGKTQEELDQLYIDDFLALQKPYEKFMQSLGMKHEEQ